MAITPNKRFLAIAEHGEKGASISIWDLQRMHRRKVFSLPEDPLEEFTSLAFSPDNKFLLAQGGAPEWTMAVWIWEKSKLVRIITLF